MFKDKGSKFAEKKLIVRLKVATALINMIDIHVIARSKATEEQVFKDQEPKKNKIKVDWEAKEKLKKFMVKTKQQISATSP
jgi:hypothetical protein